MLPSTSPPPPTIALQTSAASAEHTEDRGGLARMSPSILIITGIIALVFIICASIHLILRYISRRRHAPLRRNSPSISSSDSDSFHVEAAAADDAQQKAMIDSLPLFTLSSAVPILPKSSPDCAVCLSGFDPDDQLRLLPACRHAFHSSCIDTWLRSTPSCPLCRASISIHLPPLDPEPDGPRASGSDRSESFRVEIGSVSRRRDEVGGGVPPPPPPPHGRAYSLGSSFEYVVEEEIEAVVEAVEAHVRWSSAEGKETAGSGAAEPPGEAVAAAAAGGSGRGWLKDYVDRLTSSASSSFSSMRLSGRWSRRSDTGAGQGSWDLEGGLATEETAAYYSFYRWLIGA